MRKIALPDNVVEYFALREGDEAAWEIDPKKRCITVTFYSIAYGSPENPIYPDLYPDEFKDDLTTVKFGDTKVTSGGREVFIPKNVEDFFKLNARAKVSWQIVGTGGRVIVKFD